MKFIRSFTFLLALAAIFCLTACSSLLPRETTIPTEDPNSLVTEYAAVVTGAEDLAALDIYPNLVLLDLRGSTCYDAILTYASAHPQVEVLYDVFLGGETYDSTAESLTLTADSFTFEELIDKLAYLPRVTSVSLPETSLSASLLASLPEAFPAVSFDYTVKFGDQTIPSDAQTLNLGGITPDQLEDAISLLEKLPSLTDVELMDDEGSSLLTVPDVKLLMDAQPGASFHYSFILYGNTISTADERVEFVLEDIGNDGVAQIRQMLDILPHCTYLLMDRCKVDNDVMAQLRDDYPDTKVVWRIFYGPGYSILTDATVFRSVGDLYNGTTQTLKYLTDIVYLDAGHCFLLSDLSFVSYMPNLKVAIFSDCSVSDLTPFSACKKLEYLEIVNCNALTTLEPLAECESLKGLNMSWVFSIEELDPLYGLEHLERLYFGRHDFPQEEVDEARAALPNCWVTDHAESVAWISFNYSVGWRLDDEHTFAEWYKEIKEVFGYEREIY